MAGESAEELARRQREKAARLLKSADLYASGAEGERRTAAVLDALAGYGYVALHDLAWPGRQRANIDHVLIGPSGIYVIDSKNWSGRIVISQGTLMQNSRRRDAAIAAAGESALALAGVLGQDVMPVLCFVREEDIAGRVREVMIATTANITRLVLSRPTVLSVEQIQDLATRLRHGVGAANQTRTQRAPRPQRVKPGAPAARARAPRGGRTAQQREGAKRFLALVVGGVAVLALLPTFLGAVPEVARQVTHVLLGQPDASKSVESHEFGDVFRVPGSGVRLKVGKPIKAVPAREGAYVPQGMRLVSVHVRLRNSGKKVWRPGGPVVAKGEDTVGNRVEQWVGGQVRGRNLLSKVNALWPGKTVMGVVVFQVPRIVDLEAVSVSVDVHGKPMASWS